MKDLKSRFDILATAAEVVAGDLQGVDSELRAFANQLNETMDRVRDNFARMGSSPASQSAGEAAGSADTSAKAPDGGGRDIASMGSAMAGLGAQISSSLASAVAPLTNIGSVMAKQIDAVGGTFTTLARRIDAAMKFQSVDQFIQKLESKVPEGWQKSTLAAARFANSAKSYLTSAGDVAGRSLGRLAGIKFAPAQASAQRFSVTIKSISQGAQRAGASIGSFGKQALAAFGVFGAAYQVVNFFRSGVKAASDLNETMSATGQVFGSATNSITAQADALQKNYGVSKRMSLESANAFGAIAQGAGYSREESAKFANQLTMLSADLNSFKNIGSIADASEKIRAAVVGETEPLRRFGVVISDADVKAKAAAMGFRAVGGVLDNHAKVAARAALIQEQLAAASGDMARTADSPANAFRKLSGTMEGVSVMVGQAVMPVVSKAVSVFTNLAASIAGAFERNKGLIESFQAGLFSAVASIEEGFNRAGETANALYDAFSNTFGEGTNGMISAFCSSIVNSVKAAVEGIGSFVRNIPEYFHLGLLQAAKAFSYIEANASVVGEYLAGNWMNLILDTFNALGRAIINIGKNIYDISVSIANWVSSGFTDFKFDFTPLLKDFEATADALPKLIQPDLSAINKAMDAEWAKIGKDDQAFGEKMKKQLESSRAAMTPGVAGDEKDKAKAGQMAGKDKHETAGAYEFGSKEAISAVVKSQQGKTGDRQLKEAEKQTKLLNQIAGHGRRRDPAKPPIVQKGVQR